MSGIIALAVAVALEAGWRQMTGLQGAQGVMPAEETLWAAGDRPRARALPSIATPR